MLRLDKYGEYLVQCVDRIREKFEYNLAVRLQLYPSANQVNVIAPKREFSLVEEL